MNGTMRLGTWLAAAVVWTAAAAVGRGQPIGVEMQNTMLPIAGAMGGASIARPQELLAAVNASPAALTRFEGTQFQFGGGYAESTFHMDQTGALPLAGVTPFSGRSGTPGAAIANIGLSRQTSFLGADAVWGFALISNAGAGVDFRGIPASRGTSSSIFILEMMPSYAVKLTERLSVGANMSIGSAFFDGPFIGLSASVQDYALRGGLGVNYDVGEATSLGWYWQSRQGFTFDDAIRLELGGGTFDVARDIKMDLPTTIGFGIANQRLFDGKLLLSFDALFKQWEEAALFSSVYRNQWAFMFGGQYSLGRVRLRAGYTYAQNPITPTTATGAGGVFPPDGIPAINYVQAQFANINQNRISGGLGIVDIRPGLDVDFFAGGMLHESGVMGPLTAVDVESWWVGTGLTWRFGRRGVTAGEP